MALGTNLHQPRFNVWITVGCALLLLLMVFSPKEEIEKDANSALLEMFNTTAMDFYNGYVVAPRWQQLMTGVFTAEQIEDEIIGINDFSREEFEFLREQLAESNPDFARTSSFNKTTHIAFIYLVILTLSIVVVLACNNRVGRAMRNKYTDYLGQWTLGSLVAALLRVFAGIMFAMFISSILVIAFLYGDDYPANPPFIVLLALDVAILVTTFLLVKSYYPRWKVFVKSVRCNRQYLLTTACWYHTCTGVLLIIPIIVVQKQMQQFTSSMEITDFLDPLIVSGSPMDMLVMFVMLVMIAPVTEEILFRGFIYTALRVKIGVPSAALVTSFGFAAIHLYSWNGFVSVLLFGLVETYLFERSGSLWPGIIFHALNNILIVFGIWYVFVG